MSPETVVAKSTVSLGLGHTLCASAAGLLCWGCPCVRRGSALMKTSVPTRLLGCEVAGLPPGLSLTPRAYSCCNSGPVLAGGTGGHQPSPVLTRVFGPFPCMLGPGWCLHMTQTCWLPRLHPRASGPVWPSTCRTDGTFALLLALLSAFPHPRTCRTGWPPGGAPGPADPASPGDGLLRRSPWAAGTCVPGRAAPTSSPSVPEAHLCPCGTCLAVLVTCLSVTIHL